MTNDSSGAQQRLDIEMYRCERCGFWDSYVADIHIGMSCPYPELRGLEATVCRCCIEKSQRPYLDRLEDERWWTLTKVGWRCDDGKVSPDMMVALVSLGVYKRRKRQA